MSLYLQVDLNEPQPLATNRGWGDVLDWIRSLPAGEYLALRHLGQYGWVEPVSAVTSDLAAALARHAPSSEDVRTTTAGMLETLRNGSTGEVVSVTDGMGSDDGEDDEDGGA